MKYAEIGKNFSSIIHESDNEVYISSLNVDKDYRNNGIGTKYILEMIDYAKRHKKQLTLIPYSTKKDDMKKLKKFYKRLGFKPISIKWYYCG